MLAPGIRESINVTIIAVGLSIIEISHTTRGCLIRPASTVVVILEVIEVVTRVVIQVVTRLVNSKVAILDITNLLLPTPTSSNATNTKCHDIILVIKRNNRRNRMGRKNPPPNREWPIYSIMMDQSRISQSHHH